MTGVDVTIEPLKEDELFGRCVLLVKGYRIVDSVSITITLKLKLCKRSTNHNHHSVIHML